LDSDSRSPLGSALLGLGQTALTNAKLVDADFSNSEFSVGSTNVPGDCETQGGGSPTNLSGADLRGAQFATASGFYAGCIEVDETTIYSEGETTFPPGFTLRDEMTLVPEPAAGALQLGAILTLLHLRRRAVRHERPVDWR
jgi:hypothetical protein